MAIHLNSDNHRKEILKLLYVRYFHLLVLNAIKFVSDHDEAIEIVQDVFVRVCHDLEHLPANTDYKSYLYRSVRNSCLNYLKHKKVIENYRDKHSEDIETENVSELEKNELNKAVEQAINLLPENWREVFLLSRFEELKYYEIAGKLNISEKTVEKYISKSLKFLKIRLRDFLPILAVIFYL
jgi:RNA polymerase sigma-70 factor (ECF subfamily)